MDINDQIEYWNRVAKEKTFTHPINTALLSKYITPTAKIIDYGCGYGRIVSALTDLNYNHVIGFDTSENLIKRGQENRIANLFHLADIHTLPVDNNSVDCILLFAVLTCIPDNTSQQKLMNTLHSKLKLDGIIYISDYYLQDNLTEVKKYEALNGDLNNFGVFSLEEGVTFRHHKKEWIAELTQSFAIKENNIVEVKTMNGNSAKAFQLIGQKTSFIHQ